MNEINQTRHYWEKIPTFPHVDITFRLFEPNGVESFSCGNGLMCVANYLYLQYNIASTRILTQIPTTQPKAITIGTNPQMGTNWANMGCPQRVPKGIADLTNTKSLNDDIDILDDVTINFRTHDLHPFSNETSLNFMGYLVFTGEPHLVIFPEFGFSIDDLRNVMFVSSREGNRTNGESERRITFGSWLIHHIGTYLNKRCTHLFPRGINVDFAHIPNDADVVEYRCYERGINKETLACGTGALAVSFVANHLNLVKEKQITVWPHRSRWYDPDAHIQVKEDKNGWFIYGKPVMLLEGIFSLETSVSEQIAAVIAENPNHDQQIQIQEEINYHPAFMCRSAFDQA
jgi:diaminopimelate epimerase